MGELLPLAAVLALASQGARPEVREGVWISREEIARLPVHGPAWETVLEAARRPLPPPDLADQDSNCDVLVLARALVHARTGAAELREEVLEAIEHVMGSEAEGNVLALARNVPGYVIAADLVDLPPPLERDFRAWLRKLPGRSLQGRTLEDVHERRPNNWGTHAGGARAVIARYLGDDKELARVARVFRGWLGERDSYDRFEFGALDWQADPACPVGVNPAGATKEGHCVDGVLPDDQRRGGELRWPPPKENYVYEALQGALLQAVVLSRAGYDPWEWGERALLRAFLWLEGVADYPAEGDDGWQPSVINHFYGIDLEEDPRARPGKNVGWTPWTLGSARRE